MANQTLRKNNEFSKVFSAGIKKIGKYVIVYLLPVKKDTSRIGIITKKSIGNAVKRNKIKRILREIWRNRCIKLLSSYDVVILARKKIVQARFSEIEDELINLIKP